MTPRITKRRLLIGLTSAGVFCAGFLAGVLPAPAQQKMLIVTLLGGKTITVPVDVPPGTPLDKIQIPGITTPIVSISEAPAPQSDQPVAVGQEDQKLVGKDTRAPRTDHNAIARALRRILTHHKLAKVHKRRHHARKTTLTKPAPSPSNPTFSLALPGPAPVGVPNFFIDKFAIPPFLLPLYQAAGIQYGVRWEILAAINEIETDYGRNLAVSSKGAVGWMQFLPSTWRRWSVDANGDGRRDPYNPVDAIFSAARYLRASGVDRDPRAAIFAYNHAGWYVDSILLRAKLLGGLPADLVGSLTGLTEGRFPVRAPAEYIDEHRGAIRIFTRPGAPVIAVQDGKVVRVGRTARLGKFVRLRDAYGNTYTYAHLDKLARTPPVRRSAQGRLPLRGPRTQRLFAHPRARRSLLVGERRAARSAPAAASSARQSWGARAAATCCSRSGRPATARR